MGQVAARVPEMAAIHVRVAYMLRIGIAAHYPARNHSGQIKILTRINLEKVWFSSRWLLRKGSIFVTVDRKMQSVRTRMLPIDFDESGLHTSLALVKRGNFQTAPPWLRHNHAVGTLAAK